MQSLRAASAEPEEAHRREERTRHDKAPQRKASRVGPLRTRPAQGLVVGPEEDYGLNYLQGNLLTRHGPAKLSESVGAPGCAA